MGYQREGTVLTAASANFPEFRDLSNIIEDERIEHGSQEMRDFTAEHRLQSETWQSSTWLTSATRLYANLETTEEMQWASSASGSSWTNYGRRTYDASSNAKPRRSTQWATTAKSTPAGKSRTVYKGDATKEDWKGDATYEDYNWHRRRDSWQ